MWGNRPRLLNTARTSGQNSWYHKQKRAVHHGQTAFREYPENYDLPPILPNRCDICREDKSPGLFPEPSLLLQGDIGIDTVGFEVPLYQQAGSIHDLLAKVKNREMSSTIGSVTYIDPTSNNKVKLSFNRYRHSLNIEFNVSRFVDPDGTSLATPADVHKVLESLLRDIFDDGTALPAFAVDFEGHEDTVNWQQDWKSQIRPIRLDLARDFVVSHKDFSPELYRNIKPKSNHGVGLSLNNGQVNTWQGILKSRDGYMKFYDKYEETAKHEFRVMPAPGTFRYEYQLGRTHLEKSHLHSLVDITPKKFEHALRRGWGLSQLETPVVHPQAWQRQVALADLTPREKALAIAYLATKDFGVDIGMTDEEKSQAIQHSQMAGIDFRKSLHLQGLPVFRLNLDSKALIDMEKSDGQGTV